MSIGRMWTICRLDLLSHLKRPLFWIWMTLALLIAMVMAAGILRIHSGADVGGGVQAHITSQFANAYQMSLLFGILYPLFVSVVAGMGVLRDGELRIEALLHGTPLRPVEYVWGKFLAALVTTFAVLSIHLGLTILFKHTMAAAANPQWVGDLVFANYLWPALVFLLPLIIFVAGISFLVGESSRSGLLVNMVPLVLLLGSVFFLWTWSPSWLEPSWNRMLMLIEPTGFRWLNETWIKVDRGVDFYNSSRIVFDPGFLFSRLALVAVGLLSVVVSRRHLTRHLQGRKVTPEEVESGLVALREQAAKPRTPETRLADLEMTTRAPGFFAGAAEIARVEIMALAQHPAIWLLIPLVVLNSTFDAIYAIGVFDSPLLITPGSSAMGSLVELTFTLCLLIMFYTVESLRRERVTRLDAICFATPVRTSALIVGKAVASAAVAVVTLLAVYLTCAVLIVRQGLLFPDPWPFFIVYGLLLGPTVIFWSALVGLIYTLTESRMTTFALSVGVIIGSVLLLAAGKMSWVWNWSLSGPLRWTDIAPFELNRTPLLLNRLLVLALAALLVALTVRLLPRRRFDRARTIDRLVPSALLRTGLRLSPLLLLPLVLGVTLHKGINQGSEGRHLERWDKDYWRRNHATWLDAALPDLVHSDIELELQPKRRWFSTRGRFELTNGCEQNLTRIPITGAPHWENLTWTLNGAAYEPEDRQGLYLFTPAEPLGPGQTMTIGFAFDGVLSSGFSKNGAGSEEFILPSGVLLKGYSTSFAPALGYIESIGVNQDNRYDAREYPGDFFEGTTPALFGSNVPKTTRMQITAPEDFIMNSVGVLTDSVVKEGLRTVTWESDYPVDSFNVVGGRWHVLRGQGTAIFHHPTHTHNLAEMIETLDSARRLYAEWFHPFPWAELKVSEFPGEADYAQGFSTNITFSESMGFLTKSDPRVNAAFVVIAHETAHQWWGGMLMPGRGPGGNVLSEGASHFSTILLMDAVRGLEQRIEFCKRLEERYNNRRVVNSERTLARIDGTRSGDETVTYDKGGWAFWMLYQHLGHDSTLEGIRAFYERYVHNRDHPVLQDFLATMRPFAADPLAFDQFTTDWFHDVVLPEYSLEKASRKCIPGDSAGWETTVVVRNAGTGRMPVEVTVMQGERFSDEQSCQEQRVVVVLGPGESQEVRFRSEFEPDRIVVDPDVKVLQRGRAFAQHRF